MKKPTEKSVEEQVRDGLRVSGKRGFAPGFEDRALLRWNAERAAIDASSTVSLIEYRARRLLPLAVAASLILAVYSASASNVQEVRQGNVVARALGWTTASAPSRSSDLFESVYGLPQSNSGGN